MILIFLSLTWQLTAAVNEMVAMRVISELPSAGYVYGSQQKTDAKPEEKYNVRMKPARFSGPEHLQDLSGKCFKCRDQKYEYVMCPFHNITQEDIQAYYEPYRGVLGVWSDWTIENNEFVAMNMIEGSRCGEGTHRSTKVTFSCGAISELAEVTEPEKCRYVAKFKTPLVCGQNAMVVYPRLPGTLQRQWDEVEQNWQDGDLTEKGYKRQLEAIFVKAGFHLSPDMKRSLLHKAAGKTDESCQAALEAALAHVSQLEEELKLKDDIIKELEENKNIA
ncbi:N-acetylglucosamine-1-phosphotransferase subunit gamma [Chionoecetes opilio]|uniref:N-acetylglucosamine-1-phosphotransferase subunit gamma n=1 Tax=Chionoecetes opilio TaxID=41210 RepID=A0A8J4XVS9_CHIOP|nr:N-acetylglucosamine-1-phosphotransferase subunit gamma [Chionoecetes opilio]